MALPDFDISWSKVLPHDFGVWIECGTQCDEVYVHTAVLKLDETVDRSTSSYLDDIFVNEVVVSVQFVEYHLLRYGLECKPAERVFDGATVFGEIPDTLTRRSVSSLCGKLICHLPVWLRVATAFIKRRANSSTSTWDEEIYDESLCVCNAGRYGSKSETE